MERAAGRTEGQSTKHCRSWQSTSREKRESAEKFVDYKTHTLSLFLLRQIFFEALTERGGSGSPVLQPEVLQMEVQLSDERRRLVALHDCFRETQKLSQLGEGKKEKGANTL